MRSSVTFLHTVQIKYRGISFHFISNWIHIDFIYFRNKLSRKMTIYTIKIELIPFFPFRIIAAQKLIARKRQWIQRRRDMIGIIWLIDELEYFNNKIRLPLFKNKKTCDWMWTHIKIRKWAYIKQFHSLKWN